MVADLRRQLEEKEKAIFALEESIHLVGPGRAIDGRETREREILDADSRIGVQSVTCKDTRRIFPRSLETPLDSILSNAGHDGSLPNSNLSLSQASGVVDTNTRPGPVGEFDAHPQMMNIPDTTDMFLSAPGSSSASGKNKPLLIQDFVSKVTAEEDEDVIQLGQNARLSVNVGHKCPKLSDISISEWNVANKILFHLIETGRLPTYGDIKSYLVYSVKINQLASKYSWLSVLQYDQDYRINRNRYSFPWTYDNMHMHTYLLNPRSAAPGSGRQYRPEMQSNR